MKKAYLLVYSDSLGSREQIKQCIGAIDSIVTWRYDMPNCFYLISEASAQELSDSIRNYFGKGRFLITEISSNRQGFLPSETWHLINEKKIKR